MWRMITSGAAVVFMISILYFRCLFCTLGVVRIVQFSVNLLYHEEMELHKHSLGELVPFAGDAKTSRA